MQKNSRQRNAVKAVLMKHTDHPTAGDIYQELRMEYPNISLGTVYRNLNLLYDLGEIRKISSGDGLEHFDGNISPHYHHVCISCGAVNDIPMEIFAGINEFAQRFTEHKIMEHKTIFLGTCKNCSGLEPDESLDDVNQ